MFQNISLDNNISAAQQWRNSRFIANSINRTSSFDDKKAKKEIPNQITKGINLGTKMSEKFKS